MNPVGPDGKTRICLTCESKIHLDQDCPFNNNERRKTLSKNLSIGRCQICDSILHSKQKCPHEDQQDKDFKKIKVNMATMDSDWNPAGPDGKTRICLTCESKMHLDQDCPFNNKERNRKRNGEIAKCGTCLSEWHTVYQCPRKNISIGRCQNCDSILHSKQKCPHANQHDSEDRNEVVSVPHSHHHDKQDKENFNEVENVLHSHQHDKQDKEDFNEVESVPHSHHQDKEEFNEVVSVLHSDQQDKEDCDEVESFPPSHQQEKEDFNKTESFSNLKCIICCQLAQYAVLTPCCSSLACRACAITSIFKLKGRCGLGTCKASSVNVSSLVPHEEVRKEVEEIEVWKIVEQKEPFATNQYLFSERNRKKTYNQLATNSFFGHKQFLKRALECTSEDNESEVKRTKLSSYYSGLNSTKGVVTPPILLKPAEIENTKIQTNHIDGTKKTDSEMTQCTDAEVGTNSSREGTHNMEFENNSKDVNMPIDQDEKASYDKSPQESDETTEESCGSKAAEFRKQSVVEKFFIPFSEAPLHSGVASSVSSNEGVPCPAKSCVPEVEKSPEITRVPTIFDGVKAQCVFGGSFNSCFHNDFLSSDHISTCLGISNNFPVNSRNNADQQKLFTSNNVDFTNISAEKVVFAKPILVCDNKVNDMNTEVRFNFESPAALPSNDNSMNIRSERTRFAEPVDVSGSNSIFSKISNESPILQDNSTNLYHADQQKLFTSNNADFTNIREREPETGFTFYRSKHFANPFLQDNSTNLFQSTDKNTSFNSVNDTNHGSPIQEHESEIADAETQSKTSHLNRSPSQSNKTAEKSISFTVPIDTSAHPFFRELIISLIEAVPVISERNASRNLLQSLHEEKMDVSESFNDNCVCLEDRDEMCLSCPSFKIVLVEDTKLLPDPRSVEEKITLLARIVMDDDSEPVSSYIKLFPAVGIHFPGNFFGVPGNENFQMIAGIRKVIMDSFTHVTLVRPKMFDAKYFEAEIGQVVAMGQKVPTSVNRELDQLEELKIDFGVKDVYLKSTKDTSVFLPGKPKYSTVVIPGLKTSSHLLVNLKINGRCNKLVSRSSKYTLQDNNEILIPFKNVGDIAMEIETNSLIATATSYFTTENFKSSLELSKRTTLEKKEMSSEELSQNERPSGIDVKQIPDDCMEKSLDTDARAIAAENRIQSAGATSKWRVIFIECEKIFDGEHAQFTQIGCYACGVKNRGQTTFFSSMFPTKNEDYLEMKQKSDLLKTLHLIWKKGSGFQFIQPDGEKVKASTESVGLDDFLTFLGATAEGEDNVLFLNSADCVLPLLFNKIDPNHVKKYVAGICELKTYVNGSLGDDNYLADLSHIDDLYQRVMGKAWKEITPTCAQTAKYTFQLVEALHFEQGYRNLDHDSFVSKYFKPTSHFIEKFTNLDTNRNRNANGAEISLEIENSFRPGFPATVEMFKIQMVDLTGLSDDETAQDLDKKDTLQHLTSPKNDDKPNHSESIDMIDLTGLADDLQCKDVQDPQDLDTKKSLEQFDLGSKVSYKVLTVGTYELEAVKGKMTTILVEFVGIPPGIEVVSYDKGYYKLFCSEYGIRIPIWEGRRDKKTSPVVKGKYAFVEICLTRKKISLLHLLKDKVIIPTGTHILNCQPVNNGKSRPLSYEADLEKFIKSNLNSLHAIANCVDENMAALIRPVGVPSTEPQLTLPVPVPARRIVRNRVEIPSSSPTDTNKLTDSDGAEIPPSSPTNEKKLPEQSSQCQIPANYYCPFCSNLLANAVILPCCWMPSCDSCAREMLTIDGFRCRLCAKGNVRLHQLIPSHRLREDVLKFCGRQLFGGIPPTAASTGSLLTTKATPSEAKSQNRKLSVTESYETSMTPYQQKQVDASNSNMAVKCLTVSPTFVQTSTHALTPIFPTSLPWPPTVSHQVATKMMYPCPQCQVSCVSSKDLEIHTRNYHQPYICTQSGCDQKREGFYQMDQHYQTAHRNTSLAFTCKCGSNFTKKNRLLRHQRRRKCLQLEEGISPAAASTGSMLTTKATPSEANSQTGKLSVTDEVVCSFFSTPGGCAKGNMCMYKHVPDTKRRN